MPEATEIPAPVIRRVFLWEERKLRRVETDSERASGERGTGGGGGGEVGRRSLEVKRKCLLLGLGGELLGCQLPRDANVASFASGFASGGWDCGREEELRDEEELLLYLTVVVLTVALCCTALGIRNALDRLSAASIVVRRNVTR